MRLLNTVSIFTVDVWAVIKPLEQIKGSFESKYIIFIDSSCLQVLHVHGTSFDLDGDMKVCLFKLGQ